MAWLTAIWLEHVDEFQRMEEWFAPGAELDGRYETAIAALETEDPGAWHEECAKWGITEGSWAHFSDDWLTGEQFEWVDADRVMARVRDGFKGALAEARERQLPLSVAWVSFASTDAGFFDVGHVCGANAVTVMIATPSAQRSESAS